MFTGFYAPSSARRFINVQFSEAHEFSEGLAAVVKGSKWGCIDKTGWVLIPPQFHRAWEFSDGLTHVWLEAEAEMGHVLKTGKFLWGPSE